MYSTTTPQQERTPVRHGPVEFHGYAPTAIAVASPGLEPRPSRDLPEAVVPEVNEKGLSRHYPGASFSSGHTLPQYEKEGAQPSRRRKRILIWILIAFIVLLVIAGAVVGGILGSRRSTTVTDTTSSSSNTDSGSTPVTYTPLQYAASGFSAIDNTGLAVIADSASGRYAYQQITNGSIIEIRSGLDNDFQLKNATIVADDAMKGSPLAAVAWTSSGTSYRSVAYLDASGNVLITNTTGNGWSTPTNVIPSDAAVTTSPALALCADTDHVKGLRLYYPSRASNLIQELGLNFTSAQAGWTIMTNFRYSNINSGVACTISNGMNRVYYRHNSSIEQTYFDYTKDTNKWTVGRGSYHNYWVADSSDIAATTDNAGNDYIFYRLQDNTLTRGSINSTSYIQNYVNFTKVADSGKVGAAFLGTGSAGYTLALSQPSGANKIAWNSTSIDGSIKTNGFLD